MHNRLSIYQTKYCETMFLSCLTTHNLDLYNIQSSSGGQNNIVMPEVAKNTIITELRLNLQKRINICCCSFNRVLM